jgi:hypothetical protein
MSAKMARDHADPEGTALSIGSAMEDWAELCVGSGAVPSKRVSLKKAVNTVRFSAYIRVPKENHHIFGDK